ncbi:hypothetical protein [Deinococcus sp.]|uniref:hypothetical protein n=1 Tax=Deinococcus sp. TaxID=47478 RepID=UPI003B5C4946
MTHTAPHSPAATPAPAERGQDQATDTLTFLLLELRRLQAQCEQLEQRLMQVETHAAQQSRLIWPGERPRVQFEIDL